MVVALVGWLVGWLCDLRVAGRRISSFLCLMNLSHLNHSVTVSLFIVSSPTSSSPIESQSISFRSYAVHILTVFIFIFHFQALNIMLNTYIASNFVALSVSTQHNVFYLLTVCI
jgi:hypothetical protein